MVVTGIGISPDPTKELLVWEFSADMDPAQCYCWFLQDDFPVFRKEQMNHKSGTCGCKFSTSLWIAASSCLLSALAFPSWRHPFCTGESVCDSLSNSLHNVFSDQTHILGVLMPIPCALWGLRLQVRTAELLPSPWGQ